MSDYEEAKNEAMNEYMDEYIQIGMDKMKEKILDILNEEIEAQYRTGYEGVKLLRYIRKRIETEM